MLFKYVTISCRQAEKILGIFKLALNCLARELWLIRICGSKLGSVVAHLEMCWLI